MAIITFLLSYYLIYPTRRFAFLLGAVDSPDGVRKLQTAPRAKFGGVAIYIATLVSLLLAKAANEPECKAFLFGGGFMVLFGALDDVFSYSASYKLAIQFTVSVITALLLPNVNSDFTLPARAFIILLLTNAYNLIDGADGLCASVALTSLLFFAPSTYVSYILFFAVLGFLPSNLPAKIYLGESGAAMLGYSVAIFIIYIGKPAGLFAAILPIIELALSFIRRILKRKSPFTADREHIHHKLSDAGLSPYGLVLAFTALSLLFSLGGMFFV